MSVAAEDHLSGRWRTRLPGAKTDRAATFPVSGEPGSHGFDNQPSTTWEYRRFVKRLNEIKDHGKRINAFRRMARTDLYFLLRYVLNRVDVEEPWLLARCKEIQGSPNGHIDLWAREHYKSTIITYAKTIQDILASHGSDPLPCWKGIPVTVGIFSHTRPLAKAFLSQIKREFEENERLRHLFPDVIWTKPKAEAPKWSEDSGIVLKRDTNPTESTVEAHGLVDGMPTGRHFTILVYDDVETEGSVTTPDQVQRTTDAMALSYNLGQRGGIRRCIGTRYAYADTYRDIMGRGTFKPRLYPCTGDGTVDGVPVLLSKSEIAKKRLDMGPYIFGCQMLQDPKADEVQGFMVPWLRHYPEEDCKGVGNRYILVDPANEKHKKSDYTAMWVVDCRADGNYVVLDIVRDRLNLNERWKMLRHLHEKWQPIQNVAYERYGLQADTQHFETMMGIEHYRFGIVEVAGPDNKNDRIRRLIPLFFQHRIWLPMHCWRTNYEGVNQDLVRIFIDEEYTPFPVGRHPDMLDALARITEAETGVVFPKPTAAAQGGKRRSTRRYGGQARNGMTA